MFTQKSGSNPRYWSTPVLVVKSGSLMHLFRWQLCPSPYTFLSNQSLLPHPSQKSSEQRKEMIFERRLANSTAPIVRGLYAPSSQNLVKKALYENAVNSKRLASSLFFYRRFLSNVSMAHHNITSHRGIGDEHFVGAAIAQVWLPTSPQLEGWAI